VVVDEVKFCFEGVQEAFIKQQNLVAGNKTGIKTPDAMWELI